MIDRGQEGLSQLSQSEVATRSGRAATGAGERASHVAGYDRTPRESGPFSAMIRQILPRIRAGQFYRATARFRLLREAYSRIEARRQRRRGEGPARAAGRGHGAFSMQEVEACLAALRADGIHVGLRLPEPLMAEIVSHAGQGQCARPGQVEAFSASEVERGRLPDGRPVAVADVLDATGCAAVRRLMADPALLEIAGRHLRYRPNRLDVRLWWSFASDLTPGERRQLREAIEFHYDIVGYNAVYAYFYLSDVDGSSGPHVTVRGSHRGKPASMIFASTAQPDELVLKQYGAARLLTVEGPAGTGFFEDPACFHKAAIPLARDRLMLQFRYS